MKKPPIFFVWAFLINCSALVTCIQIAMCADSNIQQTTDKQKTWIIDRVKEHVKTLAIRNGKAHFETDGFFHSGGSEMANSFDKGEGEEFSTAADHHSSIKLKVKEISKEKGVTIEYISRFDHRSFGKSLITEDRGEITLPWK